MSEFELIGRHFTRSSPGAFLGVGDDAALLHISEGNALVVSSDMLVSGIHFFPDADPFMLGHKILAVNLSDMAAMGGLPRWAMLAIALPDADDAWLERFSSGFFTLAEQHGVELVGGDTTRGPMNMCVTILGEVPARKALRRSGAQVGDEIWISGTLGDAALALAHLQGHIELMANDFADCVSALHQPQPRVALGLALRGIASSAIDVSDGLLGDLGHVLDASEVGAEIELDLLPASNVLRRVGSFQSYMLSGGDDYELCFTAPVRRHSEIMDIGSQIDLQLACVGKIVAGRGCIVHDAGGKKIEFEAAVSYDHFR